MATAAAKKRTVIDCYVAAGDIKDGLPADLDDFYALFCYDTVEELAQWVTTYELEEDKAPVKLQIVVRRIDE